MKILVIGDIIGKPGRRAVRELLPGLRHELGADMVIANAENAAGGFGLTAETAEELLKAGCDVFTSGNHIWAQKDFLPHLDGALPVVRPANYPEGVPGRGYLIKDNVMVVNLIGRTFMGIADCPFRTMDRLLENIEPKPAVIVVDFHAEATSEKAALGFYLDGRVSAVLGTHTHVGTVDTKILPEGTAYVTDIGMTGPEDSVIGDDKESVIRRFLTGMPHHLSVGRGSPIFSAVLVSIDDETGRALSISRVDRKLEG